MVLLKNEGVLPLPASRSTVLGIVSAIQNSLHSGLKLSRETVTAGDTLTMEADVRNTGRLADDEVAELYLAPPTDGNGGLSSVVQLKGVQRLHLAPGRTKHVSFKLDARQLSEIQAQGSRAVHPGTHTISVGAAQPKDPRAPEAAQTAPFRIRGTQALPH